MEHDLFLRLDALDLKLASTELKLGQLIALLSVIQQQELKMAGELDALTAEVSRNTSLEQSAIVLIQGLAAQIAANATDPVKLAALTAQLTGSADALAAALTANTPGSPPAPEPAPAPPTA